MEPSQLVPNLLWVCNVHSEPVLFKYTVYKDSAQSGVNSNVISYMCGVNLLSDMATIIKPTTRPMQLREGCSLIKSLEVCVWED